jgi:hypothetical protein
MVPFLAIMACPVAAYQVVRHQLDEKAAADEAARTQAMAEIRERVRVYARAVIAEEDVDLTDQRLDALASEQHITVSRIWRTAGLRLVVRGTERYGWWRSSPVAACYELTFTRLGTPTAGYESRQLDVCPPRSRLPASPVGGE